MRCVRWAGRPLASARGSHSLIASVVTGNAAEDGSRRIVSCPVGEINLRARKDLQNRAFPAIQWGTMIQAMITRLHPFVLVTAGLAAPARAHHFTDEKPATLVDELLAALAHPAMHPEVVALLVVPIAVILGVWIAARRRRR